MGNPDFWAAREIWAKPVFKDVFKLFLRIDTYFLFLPEAGIVKPVKFTRDRARDELLVMSKGDHKLVHIFHFIFVFLGTVLYSTTLAGVVN